MGEVTEPERFRNNDELKYSLRSVEKYAPFFRKIFLVTNGQVPDWLDTSYEKLVLITHDQIFTNKSHLPTFNSNAIESHVHRIPGLAKNFILFNDDFFIGKKASVEDFI